MLAKLKNLGAREKWGLSIALLCLLGVLVDRLVVQTVIDQARALDQQAEREQQALLYNQRVLQGGDQVSQDYERISGLLGEGGVPTETIDRMKGEIEELARKCGLVILSMEHREPRRFEFHAEYFVDVSSFEGSMSAVLSFLNELVEKRGLVRVARITLAPARGNGQVKGSILISNVVLEAGA